MALAKKGSRILSIDKTEFRWKISRTKNAACDLGKIYVAIEPEENRTIRIVVEIEGPHQFDYPFWDQDFSVTPKAVEHLIREALVNGWNPSGTKHFEIKKSVEQIKSYQLSNSIENEDANQSVQTTAKNRRF